MSMLAERRKKSKWVLLPKKGPNKPIWDNEQKDLKFGQKLMEKMGWSIGKGLGANEQGIQEPLRVSYKNDTKGMGYKLNDDDWIEQQDEFNDLLSKLSGNKSTSENRFQKNEIKSLEEKSKKSKTRVHYQKFTRGKDLSFYSEKDLACILGSKINHVEKDIAPKKSKEKNEVIKSFEENTFGFKTTFGGSMIDYFASKQVGLKKKKEEIIVKSKSFNEINKMIDESNDSHKESIAHESKSEKHKAKKRKLLFSSNSDSLNNNAENNIYIDNENSFNEDEKVKKRKKCCDENKIKHDSEIFQNNKESESVKIEDVTEMMHNNKNKKTLESDSDQISFKNLIVKKNKKKKKTLEKTTTDEENLVFENLAITQSCNKSKNKDKSKTKTFDFLQNEKVVEDNNNTEDLKNSKIKKKKKEKKSKEPNEVIEDENSMKGELKLPISSSIEQEETDKTKTVYYDVMDNNKNNLESKAKKLKTSKKKKNNIEENNFDKIVQLDDEFKKDKSKKKKRKKEVEINESELLNSIINKNETQDSILISSQDMINPSELTGYKSLKQKEKNLESKNKKCEMDLSNLKENSGCDEILKLKKNKKQKNKIEFVEKENSGFSEVTEKRKKSKKSKKNEEKIEVEKTLEKSEVQDSNETCDKDDETKQNENEFIEANIYHSHKLGIKKKNSYQIGNMTNTKALKLYCGAEIDKFMGSNLASLEGYGKLLKRADICY